MQRNKAFEEVRFKVAQEALAGIKTGYLARKYDVTPKTIRNWVKEYQEKYGDDAVPTMDERVAESKRLAELEEKYNRALKALGEKQLEIDVLRELVKKSSPASMTDLPLRKPLSGRDTL